MCDSAESFRPEPGVGAEGRGRNDWAREAKRVGKVVLMSGLSEEGRGQRSKPLPPGTEAAHEHIHSQGAGLTIRRSVAGDVADCRMAGSEAGAFLQWATRAQVAHPRELMGWRR